MKKLLKKYQHAIRRNCIGDDYPPEGNVTFWRNRLFSNTLEFILPLSLITIIPGVVYSLMLGLYVLAIFDVFSFLFLLFIAFGKGVSIKNRKLMLMACTYLASAYLLFYIGINGPGLLFLYAGCIFGLLILSNSYTYFLAAINVIICIAFGFVIFYNLSPVDAVNEITVAEWIATSVNLIFLSFLSCVLLPRLFEGLSTTIRKQSELKVALESSLHEVEQKNHELEKFAFVASHDLQEPLRMVTGFLSQLERKYGGQLDEKAHQYIYYANDGAARMKKIIMDLLGFSQMGQLNYPKESVDLGELLDDFRVLRRSIIEEKSATVETETLPIVNSFRAPLTQVFHNLIDNALKYHRKDHPPRIMVTATDGPHHWSFSVQDNGIGIDAEDFDRIFIMFQRLHGKEDFSGTGAGLAIVKKVIDNLGGAIWVESNLGAGSIFHFKIPK